MEFAEPKAIYLQIADVICENILKGEWKPEDKIPSVRQLAVELEVNPNTVMRTYSFLQELNVIYNKRGIGYFVPENGYHSALKLIRESFIENDMPEFFRKLNILNINEQELLEYYKNSRK